MVKNIGFLAGSLQIIVTAWSLINSIISGYWSFQNIPWMLAGLSLGVFIILLSTKLKI